jgi:hypothetical protein
VNRVGNERHDYTITHVHVAVGETLADRRSQHGVFCTVGLIACGGCHSRPIGGGSQLVAREQGSGWRLASALGTDTG